MVDKTAAAVFSVSYIMSHATRKKCMDKMQKARTPQLRKQSKILPSRNSAAVLIPICDVGDCPSILYTIKSPNFRFHSGQISFPGGKVDDGETPIETALRETREEIGLASSKVDIWGVGSPIPGRRRVMIHPVVGSVADLISEDFKVNGSEVSEVFAVPIETLCNPKNQYYTQFRNGFVLPVFVADDYKIWGITAYITHTLLSCLLPKESYKNEWTKKKIDLKELDSCA